MGRGKRKDLPLTTRQGIVLLLILTVFFIVVFTLVFRWTGVQ